MIPVSSIVSMAVLFREVRRSQEAARAKENGRVDEDRRVVERAARGRNLERMRQQSRANLALSMGVSPMLMGGDPATSAYITRSAATFPNVPEPGLL